MGGLLGIGRLTLAVVFLVAGVAKLADRSGSRVAMVEFGMPPRLAGPMSVAVPVAEVFIAASLLGSTASRWGALGAMVLLLAFVATIAGNLLRGRRPDCHCFGQLHSVPAGASTLVRNVLLAGVAAFVVVAGWSDPGPSLVSWTGRLGWLWTAAALGAGLVVIVVFLQGSVILRLLRQHGRLLLRVDALEAALAGSSAVTDGERAPAPADHGLPVGAPAPHFALLAPDGEARSLADLLAPGRPLVLVFTDPSCGPCADLMPDLASWQRNHASVLSVAVLTTRSSQDDLARHGISAVLFQDHQEVAEAYRYPGTPSAVLINPDGRIGAPLVAGADAIRSFIAARLQGIGAAPTPVALRGRSDSGKGHQHQPVPVPGIGDRAPDTRLPDLDGRVIDIAQFRPDCVLLLFWDPSCGFCQRLLPELLAWEAAPPPNAPRLVLLADGSPEASRRIGLRSPVLMDENSRVRTSFGVAGTPIGVVVDGQGRIASELGVGAQGVLLLAGVGGDAAGGAMEPVDDTTIKEQADG